MQIRTDPIHHVKLFSVTLSKKIYKETIQTRQGLTANIKP